VKGTKREEKEKEKENFFIIITVPVVPGTSTYHGI